MSRQKPPETHVAPRVSDLLRLPLGAFDLGDADPGATPGFSGGKSSAEAAQAEHAPALADLQERLFAEGRTGGTRSVLLVLQGMDTSGKGGTVGHVLGQVDPEGCTITAFGKPTREEASHDFLWRIRAHLPAPGHIGVFDRSHYEDVGVVRVHDLVPRATWVRRYNSINRFEERLAAGGTRVIKCFLHISRDESKRRLLARLDNPKKHWKYKPGDVDERAFWDDYLVAYSEALTKCNTETAPWYVVPADHKWYRNWAVTKLLIEQLEEMSLVWPTADFDVKAERKRLKKSG